MARLNVTPTRMELSRLKEQLKVSVRGHKLLKDKQDELVRRFIELVHQSQKLRQSVERILAEIAEDSILACSSFSTEEIDNVFFSQQNELSVDITEKKMMGFTVSSMEFNEDAVTGSDSILAPSPSVGYISRQMQEILPQLLELAQAEKNCILLSHEIQKVRRRVNALEHLTIPQLKETIRYIKVKLEDNEREGIIRMIKGKDYSK